MVALATLEVLLDNLEEGVLFLDEQRRIVQINAAARRLLGNEGRQMVRELCPTLFEELPCAGDCPRDDRCSLSTAQGETRRTRDLILRRADGREIVLRMWAMLLPANDSHLHCSIVLRDRSREIALENAASERWGLGGLVGRTPAMQALYAQILRAAASDAHALVTGESGTGKELVARALHDNSPRARGPFVPLDCTALPEALLESELFGHAKGAFSGATHVRMGRFEAANGGTLLLDEIGELSACMQTKLLRVLQEREIVRLGENHPRKVDVRVVAATHRDLAQMVRDGSFREDLYYRLRVLPVHVPPLRERVADLALLASKMLAELGERYRRGPMQLTPEALAAIEAYHWPGNVRQLSNALEFAIVHAEGSTIERRHLLPEVGLAPAARSEASTFRPGVGEAGSFRPADDAGRAFSARVSPQATRYYRSPLAPDDEARHILEVLSQSGGNRAEAARRLGMSRTTLWKHLKRVPRTGEQR
ncbi:MAG TPA: sigma 54-interacting transcriptional regulator [Zeimonas sp.]